jgi:hypothetical protein
MANLSRGEGFWIVDFGFSEAFSDGNLLLAISRHI